jgi:hypothetical protein
MSKLSGPTRHPRARASGPRTRAGKARSSRNALRHGFTARSLRDPNVSARIQSLANIVCGQKASAAGWEQALIIAESQILIQKIRAARVAAIDHALSRPAFEVVGTIFTGAVEAFGDGDVRAAAKYMARVVKALPQWLGVKISGSGTKLKVTPAPPAPEPAQKPLQLSDIPYGINERLQEVLPELSKFDRYERRALSRQRQAMRRFLAISALDEEAEAEAGEGKEDVAQDVLV